MEILFEDRDLIVAVKPAGISSEHTPDKTGFADQLAARNGGYIGIVHRLDLSVSGVMVYAKTAFAASGLSRAAAERTLKKIYLAVVNGIPEPSGRLRDLLYHDRVRNKTFVVDRERAGVKEAILDYRLLASLRSPERSLAAVSLLTGRTHQIRVQFASRGFPLAGDRKYGSPAGGSIGLFAARLTFPHPRTRETLSFEILPSEPPFSDFSEYLTVPDFE